MSLEGDVPQYRFCRWSTRTHTDNLIRPVLHRCVAEKEIELRLTNFNSKALTSKDGEALVLLPRLLWCPIPGGAQGQAEWGPGQPELVGGEPTHGRVWNWMGFKVPSN